MTLQWIIAIVAAAVLLGTLFKIFPHRKAKEDAQFNKLVRMLLGDKQAAERLIQLEEEKTPKKSRMQLIEAAITRLRHDQR